MKTQGKRIRRKINFTGYIMTCLLDKMEFDGKKSAFLLSDINNRNKKQVPDKIWQGIVWRHLNQFNYN